MYVAIVIKLAKQQTQNINFITKTVNTIIIVFRSMFLTEFTFM